MAEQSEVTAEEEQKSRPVKLEYEQINGIRHVFDTLDEGNVGQVPKSKLQVLCASICRDLGVNYSADDLTNFKENSSSSLSCQDFVEYLQEELLPKGNVPNTSVNNKDHILPGLDINQKIKELCWKIVEQKFLSKHEHLLSENEAFQQWLVFNILDIDQRSKVHKEELGIILQMFSHGVGKAWNVKPLEEFCEEEELTFWQYLECLESVYMAGNDQSVNQEALQEICDHVLHQVIKQGYLTKKGHKIKSSKHRWFVLKPGQLLYYTSRAQQEKKGEIIVTKGAKVEGASAGKCKFIVMCADTKRVYDIEAIDQRTKQEWIAAIQSTIDTSDGPTPQHRERMQRRLQRQVRKQAKLEEERIKREQEEFMRIQQEQLDQLKQKYEETEAKAADEAAALQEEIRKREEEEKSLKREQDEILKQKQEELELLRLKHAAAEAQAQEEAEALQEEIKKREELERLQKDLEQLLENERLARVEEEKARALQEQLLVQEKKRLEELERLKAEKEQLLDMEKKSREDLEEKHREKERLLEEERTRLEELDMERQKAEEAMREAQEKLSAAEEASRLAAEEAKKKAREIKTSVGLARPIGPKVPRFVTHRGQGAFNELDFIKKEKLKEIMKEREERKLQNHQEIDSDKASEAPSSGGCDSLKATDETAVNDATDAKVSSEVPSSGGCDSLKATEETAVNDATDAKVSSEVPSSGGCDSLKATEETAVNDATVTKVSSEVPSSGGCDSLEVTEETAVNDATDAKVSSEVPSSGGCDSLKATAETAVNGATDAKVSEESDVDKNQDEMNVKETNDCCSDE